MKIGDKVQWLGALDANGNPKGGWAGDGVGHIRHYDPARDYFPGGQPGSKDSPPKGPAVLIMLDGEPVKEGERTREKFDIWVAPTSKEIRIIEEVA
jgi:hypothetical protein